MKVPDFLRPLLHLAAYYPPPLLIVTALLLLVHGAVFDEYDVFHLIWNDSPATGIANGVLTAFILGLVVMTVAVANASAANWVYQPTGASSPPQPLPKSRSYWIAWGLLLALFLLPMAYRGPKPLEEPTGSSATWAAWRWWFPAGVILAGVLFAFAGRRIPTPFAATTKAGLRILAVLALLYAMMVVWHWCAPDAYSPLLPASVTVLLFLSFLTAGLGAVTVAARRRVAWLYPAVIAMLVVPFAFPQNQVENRLPNMTNHSGGDYYRTPAQLANYDALRAGDGGGLADDTQALLAWNKRMKEEFGSAQPLVLVTCSGGASASAIYTADVLFTLETKCPGFARRIRLVSGASGGMLGAAYFVSQLRPNGMIADMQRKKEYTDYCNLLRSGASPAGDDFRKAEAAYREMIEGPGGLRQRFFAGLEADFLGPLVQKWIDKDVPTSPLGAFPWWNNTANDRGAALEEAWARHQNRALDVPFADSHKQESRGELPSLVFTPMMIEDGRQLIISNLNLDYMVETGKRSEALQGASTDGRDYLSYMGVEFFKLFPEARQFKLSTAVRMNASFPLFSPAAALPTDPVRHVVDAGYYDNYGVVVATKWLGKPANRDFLAGAYTNDKLQADKTPEVLLLRIRCFGDQQTPMMIPTAAELEKYAGEPIAPDQLGKKADEWKGRPADFPPVHTESGLFTVNAPLTGLFSAWRANMAYRSDERLASVLRDYARPREVTNRLNETSSVRVKVSEYPLFCRVEPSLNWVLTRRDIQAIHDDVRRDVGNSFAWANFYSGRGSTPNADIAKDVQLKAPAQYDHHDKRMATADQVKAEVKLAQDREADPAKTAALTPSQKAVREAKIELASKMSQLAVPAK